jgi:hypothetical protein
MRNGLRVAMAGAPASPALWATADEAASVLRSLAIAPAPTSAADALKKSRLNIS